MLSHAVLLPDVTSHALTCCLIARCLKSVVFVLDELDVFTKKGKQVLLYNLLDTLAHSKVQVGNSCEA
jgi:Cdc6-like AAA superfamily ATPase